MPDENSLGGKWLFLSKLADYFYRYTSIRVKPEQVVKMAEAKKAEALMAGQAMLRIGEMGLEGSYVDGQITVHSNPKQVKLRGEENPIHLETITNEEQQEARALVARSVQRQLHDGLRKQTSLEAITGIAGQQIQDQESVSPEEVGEDWLTRFFRSAEDVSSEQMRQVWGKVLAGEVKHPGSFSLRALDILRNMSQEEADILNTWSRYCIWTWPLGTIRSGYVAKDFVSDDHINLSTYSVLESLGVTTGGGNVSIVYYKRPLGSKMILRCGNNVISIEGSDNSKDYRFGSYIFTKEGVQIVRMIGSECDTDYLKSFARSLSDRMGMVVRVGDGIREREDRIEWDNRTVFEPE